MAKIHLQVTITSINKCIRNLDALQITFNLSSSGPEYCALSLFRLLEFNKSNEFVGHWDKILCLCCRRVPFRLASQPAINFLYIGVGKKVKVWHHVAKSAIRYTLI